VHKRNTVWSPRGSPEEAIRIWSVALEDENGNWMSDFWYWFNEHQQGVIFSLAPAPSLTVIYYQTFVQNGPIPACVLCNPCADLPPCAGEQLEMVRSKPRFFPFTHSLS